MSTVILIGGDGGTGKTKNGQVFPEPTAYLDFEYPKGNKCREQNHPERLITVFPCREIHGYKLNGLKFEKEKVASGFKRGQINVTATNDLIKKTIDKILDTSQDYETIVLDSISDIREIVADQWLIDYRKKDSKNAGRKVIGKDPSAWSAINKTVCDDILFPIINIGRIENKNIVFTARLEDEYKVVTMADGKEDTAKTGRRTIDTQDWVTFEIDVIAELSVTEKGRYSMVCKKTPKGVIGKTDITDKTVFDILSEKGIL